MVGIEKSVSHTVQIINNVIQAPHHFRVHLQLVTGQQGM
jgi:hypothetical protein